MNPSYLAYQLLTTAAAPLVIPLIWLHHRLHGEDFQRFYQRIGIYPAGLLHQMADAPRIWMHAVSVGEVGVAAAISKALHERLGPAALAVSTVREQGLSRSRSLLGPQVPSFFAPLDLLGPTRKALRWLRPDALVLLETEIWPNLIVQAKRMGIPTAIVNGRISPRSIRRYRKIRPLMAYVLSHIDTFSLISEDDARRFRCLGAHPDRIQVNGNAKFDGPDPLGDDRTGDGVRSLFNLDARTPVLVAGSTRHDEERLLLTAFQKIRQHVPGAVMILAPRHIERVEQIAQWVADHGLSCQLRSRIDPQAHPRTASVVILDTMGELSGVYSVASAVFCGGSLVPKGGQNILEPAIWGKPVFYGPSMEDFADARQAIQLNGGGREVRCVEEIIEVARRWLQFPSDAASTGRAARSAVLPHRGAARKHAAAIQDLLAKSR